MFPDVHPNEPFRPSASLSNKVRHLINGIDGFKGSSRSALQPDDIRIQVYNNTENVLLEGTAVNFDEEGELCGEAVPCRAFDDIAANWGILTRSIAPDEFGNCIVAGKVFVTLSSDGTGNFAIPDSSNPSRFVRNSTGAKIFFSDAEGKALIVIGSGNGGSGGGGAVLCRVTGGSSQTGYIVDVYSNGRYFPPTGSGVVFLPEVALSASLPADTWMIAHEIETLVTGGNDI